MLKIDKRVFVNSHCLSGESLSQSICFAVPLKLMTHAQASTRQKAEASSEQLNVTNSAYETHSDLPC